VKLEQNGRSLTWRVPAKMSDGQTDDNWYPYVFLKTDSEPTNHNRRFQALNPFHTDADGNPKLDWLVHAAELKAGDQIYFTPATLDFQWLDSAGRRFEIAYDENGRRRNHLTRPYLLDELETIAEAWEIIAGTDGLTNSQIHALRDLVETKRENWQLTPEQSRKDDTFRQFCRDAIVNANWKGSLDRKQVDRLTNWAVSGLLTDVIQLYMGIMKQKPKREENNERTE